MNPYVDLLIENIGQLCIIPAGKKGAQRGAEFGNLGLIDHAAVAIRNGKIIATGKHDDLKAQYSPITTLDAQNALVTPGLVDPHTHLIWAGDRADEFEQRAQGVSYQEIMANGGGINRTVRQTRGASLWDLIEQATNRLDRMLAHGTTTAEIKTGYGLDPQTEITMLNAIALLDVEHPIDIIPTFLGAHAIPPEYADNPDGYVTLLVDRLLPAVGAWKAEHWPSELYCDVFCEEGAFTLAQTQRIFEAAQRVGLPLKIHADEFASLGGTALAAEFGACSADHLLVTTPEDVALLGKSDTVAVLLPATPFGLNIKNTAPAKALIEAGAAVALASDCNPGTAWCESMQTALSLAVRTLGMTQAQALAAATINAAAAINCDHQLGSLENGKQADLVIWDVPDYRHLGYRFGANLVRQVIKRGELVIG